MTSGTTDIDVIMPQLGETVAEGTVTRWLKSVGDHVGDQEPLLEISTDKVDTEVPSPGAGILSEILVDVDATVAVGTRLAVIGATSAQPNAAASPRGGSVATSNPAEDAVPSQSLKTPLFFSDPSKTTAITRPVPTGEAAQSPGSRHRHSPKVRRLAREAGLDPDVVTGTGPGGRTTPADIAAAATSGDRPQTPTAGDSVSFGPEVTHGRTPHAQAVTQDGLRREPMTRLRSVVAERMMTSLRTSAQLTTVIEIDVTAAVEAQRRHAERAAAQDGTRLTLTAIFARAAIDALRVAPLLNAAIDADGRTVIYHTAVNLGLAVDTERGLLVPVIQDAGSLNVVGLARAVQDLADRARSGTLEADALTGGTFTLTNTGSRGALFDTPILVPGQTGILGTGAAVDRPVVHRQAQGERVIAIRSMAFFALTYDHRLVDGADAARYLAALKGRLEGDRVDAELA